jgi:REP element-mobilizing transposase RayT
MPEHVHAVLFGAKDVVQWVALFKSATTTAARRGGLVLRIWQRRFHDRSLDRTTAALEAATTYVVENPVRRGLVQDWEDWPYVRIGWT